MIELLLLLAIGGFAHAVMGSAQVTAAGGAELAFGYLVLAAFLGARVLGRLGLPRMTGYLAVGVLSGPFVLGLIDDRMASELGGISDIAACALGLIAGSRFELDRVRPLLSTMRAITMFGIVAAMFVLPAVLFAMRPVLPMFAGIPTEHCVIACVLVGVGLAAQSPAVVLALISETRSDGPLSRVILATVVVADLVVVIAYSLLSVVAGALVGDSLEPATLLAAAWVLVGSLGFGVMIGMLIALYARYIGKGIVTFAVLACIAVATVGTPMHLNPLMVMLAAGVYISNFSRACARGLLQRFETAELPVFLVFFAVAGCRLDLGQLWSTIVPVAAIAIMRAAVFFVGCRAASERTRADDVIARHAWTGLVPQAGLSLAFAVTIQRDFPTFGPGAAVLMLSVIAINQLIAPVLLRASLVRSREVGLAHRPAS